LHDSDRADANPVEEERLREERKFTRCLFEGIIEVYRIAFKNTGNPVYVFAAIRLFSPTMLAAWQGADPSGGRDVALPNWCVNYLTQCAQAVERVSYGSDPRRDEVSLRITDAQKVDLLPRLFGFVRPGWNAFADFYSAFKMRWPEKYFAEMRSDGMSYARAMAETAARFGYEDERSLRRRLAKRRAVFQDDETDETDGGQT